MTKKRAYSKETRDKVLTIITIEGINGISNNKVAKKVEKDRNIVTAICDELENDSLIRIETIGKGKIYYPTDKILDTITFADSIFFGYELRTHLIRSKLFGFEFNLNELSELQQHQIQYLENLRNGEMELLPMHLQNFILKIGTIITYTLIQAMSLEFTKKISNAQYVTDKISVDKFIQEWVKNVILSLNLLHEIRTIILESEFHPSLYDSNKKSHYELDENLKNNAIEVLKQLYPEILRRLERVYNCLERDFKKEKEQCKQVGCNHDFSSKTMQGPQKDIIEFNNPLTLSTYRYEVETEKGFKKFYCKKCNLTITQNLVSEITDKSLIIQLENIASTSPISENNIKQSKNYKFRKFQINDIKSPSVFKCKSNCHVWSKDSISSQILRHDSKFDEKYRCLLCNIVVNLEIIDRETISNILRSIERKVGKDRYTLLIADTILDSFYSNQIKHYSLEDFKMPEYLNFRNRKSRSLPEFLNDRNKIIDIFVRFNIIKNDRSGKYYFINKGLLKVV